MREAQKSMTPPGPSIITPLFIIHVYNKVGGANQGHVRSGPQLYIKTIICPPALQSDC
jgi:hypothetical protein